MIPIIFSDMNNALALVEKLGLTVEEPSQITTSLRGTPLLGRRGEPSVILQKFFQDLAEANFRLHEAKAVRRYRYVQGERTNECIGVSVELKITNDPHITHDAETWQKIIEFYGENPVPCATAWKNTDQSAFANLTVNIVPTQSDPESPVFLRYQNEEIVTSFDRT